MSAPLLASFPSVLELAPLIALAVAEDLGPQGDDVTSRLLITEGESATATLVQKSTGVIAGLPIVAQVCAAYDPRLCVDPLGSMEALEGHFSETRLLPLVRITGPLRSILSAERVVLNFVQRMSGVATLTRQYVDRVVGTKACILDTRKTIPGHRALDKYAVRAGGGRNHRIGLYDGVLVKDNHLARLAVSEIAPYLARVVEQSRREDPSRLFEVEVDVLAQLAEVLKVPHITVVLLDNMSLPDMAIAVRQRDALDGNPLLEASGGVNLETVRAIAETGVDRISVGALTHSAPALDIGLDIVR